MVNDLNLCISNGNSKIGNRVMNISLLPGVTCERGVPCFHDGCYAQSSVHRWSTVREAWTRNTEEYFKDPDRYFEIIEERIREKNPRFFRWHVGGDIPDYYYMWGVIEIAQKFPKTRFLLFTKKYSYPPKSDLVPDNLKIVLSVWPGYPEPERTDYPWAWLSEDVRLRYRKDEVYLKCVGSCEKCGMSCWKGLHKDIHVIFDKH